jgi:nucleotide-binding universal stress UspA family protein
MKIAIGFDGSDYAKAAIDDLRRSGVPLDASALIISVGETLLPPVPVSATEEDAVVSRRILATQAQARAQASQALRDARAIAEDGRERVRRLFPNWDVQTVALVGMPAVMLMATADQWDADVIVIGSHGRSAIGRFVLGSVSKQIATTSSRSVLVARHVVARGASPIRVIIGVDGSPGADAAVRAVATGTWPEGTELRVLAVDDTIRPTGTLKLVPQAAAAVSESNQQRVDQMQLMLRGAANRFREAGLQATGELKNGSPQRVLCEEAQRWGADCIFVGARGFDSTVERFRSGSVSTAVVTSAPCSVEIVR